MRRHNGDLLVRSYPRRTLSIQQMEPALRRLESHKREMGVLQMRKLFIYSALSAFCFVGRAHAAVNVSFSTAAPKSIQQEFIASTTGFYLSTVTKSPYFADTYSLTIHGKNPNYQPPAVSSPILTATAFEACAAYGVGNGMDYERYANTQLIYALQGQDFAKGTCGFQTISASPQTVSVSTNSCALSCLGVYNVIISTISQRWGYIFNSTGGVVAQ